MKLLCTLPAIVIFLLSLGLPFLAFLIFLTLDSFVGLNPSSNIQSDSNYTFSFVLGIWVLGTLFLQVWGLSAIVQLGKKLTNRASLSRTALFFGIFSLTTILIFFYALIETFWLPATNVGESAGGFYSNDSVGRIYTVPSTLFFIWYLPRLLFFGYLSKILTLIERESSWLLTMMLFVLWPIGIWFLQPRIRAIVGIKKVLAVSDHMIGRN